MICARPALPLVVGVLAASIPRRRVMSQFVYNSYKRLNLKESYSELSIRDYSLMRAEGSSWRTCVTIAQILILMCDP